jgi:ribosomal protein L28
MQATYTVTQVRSLQEELLAERADSITLTDRNGSVIGAPSMNFKKPSPVLQQQQQQALTGAGGRVGTSGSLTPTGTDRAANADMHKRALLGLMSSSAAVSVRACTACLKSTRQCAADHSCGAPAAAILDAWRCLDCKGRQLMLAPSHSVPESAPASVRAHACTA